MAFTLLKKPIEFGLLELQYDELKSDMIAGIISRFLLVLVAILIIKNLNLQNINGFGQKIILRNYQALILPLLIIVLVAFSNFNTYTIFDNDMLIIFTISVLLVGFAEELTFRGIILPVIIRANGEKNNAILIGIVLSSVLFGLIHYVNLFKDLNFSRITSIVIFATCFGSFAGGLFLRTGNIALVAVLHGLFNFAFNTSILNGEVSSGRIFDPSKTSDWISLLITLSIFGFIFGSGIYMAKISDKIQIFKKIF